ncbi:MotE family protein [Butyrivibrio sp. NC3005]|uniref:MotE family protein n=1 Tax=Butyrivibrio sp. NC3005 TaxID=1280685 RepID=UPI0004014FA7|nr:hypothetical protein [Butyrivibrio sp. NC3005]
MADKKNKNEEPEYKLPDDPVEAKKKLKADQKQLKEDQKAARKAEKARQKQMKEAQDELEGEKGGGFGTFLLVILIIMLWLLLMAIVIKLDIGGLGQRLTPVLKDIPYINRLLPVETSEISESDLPNADASSTSKGVNDEYIKGMENELATAQSDNATLQATIKRLQAEVSRLEPFEQEQSEFEKQRQKFYEDIVYNEKAPDASVYASYYEMIAADAAASIYAQVVAGRMDDEEVKKYAATYSGMKPKAAAAIFNVMPDLNLAARILKQMSSDSRGAILAQMDKEIAAQITSIMEPENLPQLSDSSATGK